MYADYCEDAAKIEASDLWSPVDSFELATRLEKRTMQKYKLPPKSDELLLDILNQLQNGYTKQSSRAKKGISSGGMQHR